AHHGAGQALQATGKLVEGLAAFRRSRAVREPLAREAAAVPDDRLDLAFSIQCIGSLLDETGDTAGALAELPGALELRRAPAPPDRAPSRRWVGRLPEKAGDRAGPLAEQGGTQELPRALAAEPPAVPAYRHSLASSHGRVSLLLEATGDLAGALAGYREGQEL